MKNMKFRIKNERHSSAIQNELFRLGNKWNNPNNTVLYTYARYIYCNNGKISFGTEAVNFNSDTATETTLDELYDMEKEPEKVEWYRVTAFAKESERPEIYYVLYTSKEDFLNRQEGNQFHWIKLEKVEVGK